jgi:hypothetical protein
VGYGFENLLAPADAACAVNSAQQRQLGRQGLPDIASYNI